MMELRAACIKLLKKETSMLKLWNTPLKELPDVKNRVTKLLAMIAGIAAVFLLRVWMMSLQDSLFAEDKYSALGIILRLPVGLAFLAMIVLGIFAAGNVFALFTDIDHYRYARKSNGILEDRKAASRREYDALRSQVAEMRKQDPALADRQLFFDDPHPLETTEKPVRGKLCTGTYESIYTIGEMAFRMISGDRLRLDGYYSAKSAKIWEIQPLLRDPEYPYACPVWDQEYMEANPQGDCIIHTLTRINVKPTPLDNRDFETKLKPKEAFDLFCDAAKDPVSVFVRSGLYDMPNLSRADDRRIVSMNQYIAEYSQQIRERKDQLKYQEYARYGCAQAYVQQMGYLVLSADEKDRVLAVIIPRFHTPTYNLFYSLDLYYDEQKASQQFVGQVMSMSWDLRGSVPDFLEAAQTAIKDRTLPVFDPLQEPLENLDRAAWHELLRICAAMEE